MVAAQNPSQGALEPQGTVTQPRRGLQRQHSTVEEYDDHGEVGSTAFAMRLSKKDLKRVLTAVDEAEGPQHPHEPEHFDDVVVLVQLHEGETGDEGDHEVDFVPVAFEVAFGAVAGKPVHYYLYEAL